MTPYVRTDAEQAFFTAVAAVFAEHREASARFGLCDVDRLAEVFGHRSRERFGLRRDESGKVSAVGSDSFGAATDAEEIASTFPASVQDPFAGPVNPMTGEPEGACIAIVPEPTGEGLEWSCITYLTS